jgi:hypothetical protein
VIARRREIPYGKSLGLSFTRPHERKHPRVEQDPLQWSKPEITWNRVSSFMHLTTFFQKSSLFWIVLYVQCVCASDFVAV